MRTPPDSRPVLHEGDGWVECRCGARHWGRFGAAGLLLLGEDRDGAPAVVLQHRALWSHHGGTWGIPGGALAPHEDAAQGAVREAVEEAGVPGGSVRTWASSAVVHLDWSYTTVVGEAVDVFTPAATDAESLEVAWVPVPRVAERDLLPAFADAWPDLRALLGRRLALVVDGANVVGSRPDGWWRDRPGAAERLHARLAGSLAEGFSAADLRLPGTRWWPDVLLVLEGAARAAALDGGPLAPGRAPLLGVTRAAGSGDDEIVAATRSLLRPGGYTDVVVVTADRALGERVRAAGGTVVGPRVVPRAGGE